MGVYLGSSGMVMLRRSAGEQSITIKLTADSSTSQSRDQRKLLVWALPSEDGKASDKNNDLGDKASDWQEYVRLTSLSTGDKVTFTSTVNLAFIDKNSLHGNSGSSTALDKKTWSFFVYVDDMGSIRLYDAKSPSGFKDSLAGAITNAVKIREIASGTTYTVTVSIDNMDYRVLGEVINYELNTTREAIDVTTISDQFRQQYSSLMTGSGRIICNWDYANLGVSNRWVGNEQQTVTTKDGNYQEVPHYLNQLLLRAEIGSEFLAHFFLKTSNGQTGTGDDQVWYNVRGVLTNVAMQFNMGDIIRMTAEFITTGPFFLQSATETEYNLLLESGYDVLMDQNDDKIISKTGTSD